MPNCTKNMEPDDNLYVYVKELLGGEGSPAFEIVRAVAMLFLRLLALTGEWWA